MTLSAISSQILHKQNPVIKPFKGITLFIWLSSQVHPTKNLSTFVNKTDIPTLLYMTHHVHSDSIVMMNHPEVLMLDLLQFIYWYNYCLTIV